MIEVNNKLYTQRFLATKLKRTDIFRAVTYTQFEGQCDIPFWYKQIPGETSTIDLTQTEEQLFKAMKSNTRNEVKRAIKEGCEFDYNFDYASFVPYFNEFAISKGLSERVNISTLQKYNRTYITIAKKDGVILAMHATVVNDTDEEAMLLYSCSRRIDANVDKKLIGWANRFLHYQEFLFFKQLGIKRYEWNGVCTNSERVDVYNISLFKLAFGSDAKAQLNLRTPLFVLMKFVQKLISHLRHH